MFHNCCMWSVFAWNQDLRTWYPMKQHETTKRLTCKWSFHASPRHLELLCFGWAKPLLLTNWCTPTCPTCHAIVKHPGWKIKTPRPLSALPMCLSSIAFNSFQLSCRTRFQWPANDANSCQYSANIIQYIGNTLVPCWGLHIHRHFNTTIDGPDAVFLFGAMMKRFLGVDLGEMKPLAPGF